MEDFEAQIAKITSNIKKRSEKYSNNRINSKESIYRKKIDNAINYSKWKLNHTNVISKDNFN